MSQGLCTALVDATEDAVNLILETLATVIAQDKRTSLADVEAVVAPMILKIWAENFNDPLLQSDVSDILDVLIDRPECLPSLCNRAFPTLGTIISNPSQQPNGLVEAALDIATVLLKRSTPETAALAYGTLYDPIIRLAVENDDHGILQSSAESLRAFVRAAGSGVLNIEGKSKSHTY